MISRHHRIHPGPGTVDASWDETAPARKLTKEMEKEVLEVARTREQEGVLDAGAGNVEKIQEEEAGLIDYIIKNFRTIG